MKNEWYKRISKSVTVKGYHKRSQLEIISWVPWGCACSRTRIVFGLPRIEEAVKLRDLLTEFIDRQEEVKKQIAQDVEKQIKEWGVENGKD